MKYNTVVIGAGLAGLIAKGTIMAYRIIVINNKT